MEVSRRRFLIGTGQGLVLASISDALALGAIPDESTNPEETLFLPTAHVPLNCRVDHGFFEPNDPPQKIPFANQVRLLRPHDLLHLRFRFFGLKLQSRWRGPVLIKTQPRAFL